MTTTPARSSASAPAPTGAFACPRKRILLAAALRGIAFAWLILFALPMQAQQPATLSADMTKPVPPPSPEKKWFESMSLRGYVQLRYNRLLETNPQLKCEQCDRSWGENGSFFLRRVRIIFFGQISKNVYFYIQPDFASTVGTGVHFAQLRDAYLDVGFDPKNEFRVRLGQCKVPFGFENMQSSQNRLPLDRADALNSAVANERDLGAFFYWAPEEKRKLFSSLVRDGLKGSGDYGVIGFGLYNGQTANQPDFDIPQPDSDKGKKNLHVVGRVSYPMKVGKQLIEPGIQGYTGKFTVTNLSTGTKIDPSRAYTDQRLAATFVLYPQPFGILAEYNVGKGPEFNPATDSIEVQNLQGGFVTLSYMQKIGKQIIIPFFRYQYYDGGKKHERDARSYTVHDAEIGIEWQPVRAFELVAMYTISNRRFEDFVLQDNTQEGKLLRLQAQLNF